MLDPRDADAEGRIAPPDVGQVVLSVPSPETFVREPDTVRRVIDGAGTGEAPLVVVVEAAEELRDDELAVVLAAARSNGAAGRAAHCRRGLTETASARRGWGVAGIRSRRPPPAGS